MFNKRDENRVGEGEQKAEINPQPPFLTKGSGVARVIAVKFAADLVAGIGFMAVLFPPVRNNQASAYSLNISDSSAGKGLSQAAVV